MPAQTTKHPRQPRPSGHTRVAANGLFSCVSGACVRARLGTRGCGSSCTLAPPSGFGRARALTPPRPRRHLAVEAQELPVFAPLRLPRACDCAHPFPPHPGRAALRPCGHSLPFAVPLSPIFPFCLHSPSPFILSPGARCQPRSDPALLSALPLARLAVATEAGALLRQLFPLHPPRLV